MIQATQQKQRTLEKFTSFNLSSFFTLKHDNLRDNYEVSNHSLSALYIANDETTKTHFDTLRPKSTKQYSFDTNFTSPVPCIVQETSSNTDYRNRHETLSYLSKTITPWIVYKISKANFEDGIENDLTLLVKNLYNKYNIDVVLWLLSLYTSTQNQATVLAGLLRIISMAIPSSCDEYLLPMIKSGLYDKNPEAQEAALMVIEQWRTQLCLTTLESLNTDSLSPIFRPYIEKIKLELTKEL